MTAPRLVRPTLLGAALAALAAPALADGREPGSVLVFPYQRSALVMNGELPTDPSQEEIQAAAVFNVVSVTNTNRNGDATTDLHFEYVNVDASGSAFLFATCTIADRVETLTPADTLSVLTSCHNSAFSSEGYLVVTALDPDLIDTPWSFDHLIGSAQIVSAAGGMYGLSAIPFTSPVAERSATDLDGDGKLDFDDEEYERLPDYMYIDSFVGNFENDLVLLSFTGGEYLVSVDFIIYNDDEFQLSSEFSFACWTKSELGKISGYFTEEGLSTTPSDTAELDIDCDLQEDYETGWAIVRPGKALSITSANLEDAPVLGALVVDQDIFQGARLLWESVERQGDASFPN